jgi:hypothetical protein
MGDQLPQQWPAFAPCIGFVRKNVLICRPDLGVQDVVLDNKQKSKAQGKHGKPTENQRSVLLRRIECKSAYNLTGLPVIEDQSFKKYESINSCERDNIPPVKSYQNYVNTLINPLMHVWTYQQYISDAPTFGGFPGKIRAGLWDSHYRTQGGYLRNYVPEGCTLRCSHRA